MNSDDLSVLLERIDTLSARVRQLERAGMPASTAIPPSPVAQGDLIAADATPAWGLLSIGNASEILKVNTSGTAPEWRPEDAARARRTTSLSIADNVTTAITWQSVNFDTGDTNWSAGAPTRLTAQRPGIYLIILGLDWTINTTGRRYADILVNGVTIVAMQEFAQTATGQARHSLCSIFQLATSTYVEGRAYQNSGGALSIKVTSMHAHLDLIRIA